MFSSQGEYDKSRWFDAIKSGNIEAVKAELNSYPKAFLVTMTDNSSSRQTALFQVVQIADLERGDTILELLLLEGADANCSDSLQQTPLFYAARFGHNKQIKMLIEAGAEPNHRDNYGQTALYYCTREGQSDSISLFLELGGNVNSVDNLGQTAIFYSCREGKFDSTAILVENGANVNHSDKTRNTPLSWAKRSGNNKLIDYLISKGAVDKNTKKKKENTERKEEKRKQEKRSKCQLMIVDEFGEKRPATDEEKENFEKNYPDLAKYWLQPETLEELDKMDQDAIDALRPWEKPAKKIMNALWKHNSSWVFHEKVDPVKLGLPDYFEIVKNPMDFGTIRKKLSNNAYPAAHDFFADVDLVFGNCRLYNPPESDVAKMCAVVENFYAGQLTLLGLDKYK